MNDDRTGRRSPASHQSTRASAAPVVESLETPAAGGGGGWRMAAVVIGLALVAVVIAGRLGMQDLPDGSASPLPSPPALAEATPPVEQPQPVASDSPSPGEDPSPSPRRLQPAPDVGAVPDLPRHLDGIPTSVGGEKVFRLGSALLRGGDHMLLVGGWYLGPDCLRVGRCVGRLADSPAAALRSEHSAALEGVLDSNNGPRVVRAVVRQSCLGESTARCMPTLTVLETVWTGDFYTRAEPIAAQPLLAALSFAFPDMRAEPFRDFARCPLDWPPQTYRSTRGGPRMVLIFPSTADRLQAESAIRAGWPRPPEGAAGQCTDHFMVLADGGDWLAEDNVMLWVSHAELAQALARAALADARDQSPPAAELEHRPLTTLDALTALRRWEVGIDLLGQHDYTVWGPNVPGEAYALSDPLIRLLLVFPSREERRTYQRDVSADELIVLSGVRPTQRNVGVRLLEVRGAGVRWVGYQNVLLQVAGPNSFDEQLREVLARD